MSEIVFPKRLFSVFPKRLFSSDKVRKTAKKEAQEKSINKVGFNGISIYCTVRSETINTNQFYLNPTPKPFVYKSKDGLKKCIILATLRYTDQYVQRLLKVALKDDKEEINRILLERFDEFYVNCRIDVITKGYNTIGTAKTILKPSKQTTKNVSSRFQDPKTKTYKELKTIVKNYDLKAPGDEVKSIPYMNYEDNRSDINCVYNYVKSRYSKIKKLDKYFEKDKVIVNDIDEFCAKYKIPLVLYNIDKQVIFSNKIKTSKNYPDFVGIIANGHFYPRTNKSKKFDLTDERTIDKMNFNIDSDIIISQTGSSSAILYNKTGVMSGRIENGEIEPEISQVEIDNAFFKGMPTNFFFKSDCLKAIALMYTHEDISTKMICEHDINKAYYNIAFNIIDRQSEYPIFTAQDMWTKYDSDEIDTLNYYLLSNKVKDQLLENGLISNFHDGHMISYLLDKKIIKRSNIIAVKIPSYRAVWSDILKRIESLAEKNPNINKEFIMYNGILGKTHNTKILQYSNIKLSDIDIMKGFEIGHVNEDNEFGIIKKQFETTYKYINHVNLYNHIVGTTSLYLLMYRDRVLELNPDAKVLKIKTDAIGFDRVVDIPDEYKEIFKYLDKTTIDKDTKEPKMCTNFLKYVFHYNSYKSINEEVENEMKTFNKNITFFGAPGTGKTTLIKKDHDYDNACTWTNVCSLNLMKDQTDTKVSTVYSLLNLYNPGDMMNHFQRYRNKKIWIDEFSMIQNSLWNYFAVLGLRFNTEFIITGDIDQISPISEKKINLDNIFIKNFFNDVTTLTKDYRNDKDLQELRDDIIKGYPDIKYSNEDYTKYDFHIVALNETRKAINSYIMKARGYKFKYIYKNGKAVSIDISPGVMISPRKSIKKQKLFKNDIWKIIKKTENGYLCQNYLRGEEHEFNNEQILIMQLAFAVTCHSIQGATLTNKFCIHEAQRMMNWDKSILYTAVTRGKSLKNINIYKGVPKPPKNFNEANDMIVINYLDMSDDEEFEKFDKVVLNK